MLIVILFSLLLLKLSFTCEFNEDECMHKCTNMLVADMKFENNGNGHLYIELVNENYDFKLEDAEAISQCMVTCNLTKGYSVSNIEEDIIPDMLNKVVRIDHNPGLTKRESQYYATGHSKPKCKGAINWSMEMNVDNK